MWCTGRGTSYGVKTWDGQCEMDIIRRNGKVWGYYWQSMVDNVACTYKVKDIIEKTGITLVKWQRARVRIGNSWTLLQ